MAALYWIGYGYQIARQKLGSYFYTGESEEPENARVGMLHSSMEKDSEKADTTSTTPPQPLSALEELIDILSSLQKPIAECPIRLIFSTVALGMGADLKHVQRVIHAGPPTSLERMFYFNI
ncbi:hypothetical protein DPMN_053424 [Dreissena polymorpha]|uniref:Uncharacterized protein n=1 Tax=Dreissena polymorpha TaxID=45954 RepID=A0A9D4CMK8_DREPO|nr:hypothetical protein DPMN_053424 [Dreissena polymorpha]